MPLVRLEVRNEYGLGGEELYNNNNNNNKEGSSSSSEEQPKAVLEGVVVAGLVGILRQLGDLAEFAAEVFHGLQEQVVTIGCRSDKMIVRVKQIESAVPTIEKAVVAQTSHIHFAYTAGCEWHPKVVRVKQKHLIRSDLPSFIMDTYEECHDPPRLQLLDKFDTGGDGACLRRYSDPSFFRKSINRSEPMNSGKVQREKRSRKSKKKASRWRNGELSHTLSLSQCSGRMQFSSPNSYGQSSAGETSSTIHMRSKSDQGDHSISSDSKTRSGYIECVFDGSSLMKQKDKEHNKLPAAALKMQNGGATDSVLLDKQKGGAYDRSIPGSLQDLNSSSITWDEKTEIWEPKHLQSDNVVVDSLASELLHKRSDLAKEEDGAAAYGIVDPEDVVCTGANIPETLSEVDEFTEVGSEPDRYADALNTLESEAETDIECQTKRELEKPLAMFPSEGIKPCETRDMKSELPSVNSVASVYWSSKKRMSQNNSNLVSSEDMVCTQPPEITVIRSDQSNSVENELSESTDGLNGSRVNGCEPSTSNPPFSLSNGPDSEALLHDKIICSSSDPQGSLLEVSEASPISVWTNGGLLGLEPSKPPDYNISNSKHHNSMANVEDISNHLSQNIFLPKSHPNGSTRKVDLLVYTPKPKENQKSQVGIDRSPGIVKGNDLHSDPQITRIAHMVQTVDNSECLTSHHGKQKDDVLNEDLPKFFSTFPQAVSGISKDSCQLHSLNNHHENNPTKTGAMTLQHDDSVASGAKFSSSEASREKTRSSFSMFGLSQRLQQDGYQRTESIRDDVSKPPGCVETGVKRLNEPQCIHHIEKSKGLHHTPPVGSLKKQLKNGSPVNSLPSSPPLEHMKISFCPTDGFETSKLKLRFPGGHHFHESIKDVMFPSFQLLPEPAVLRQHFDSESENNTFCRSSPYLSDETMSQYSDSSSEQWECGDTPDDKENGVYDALRRVSSTESISSVFELEGISNGSIHLDDDFKRPNLDNGLKKLRPLSDLPSFDMVSSFADQQEWKCDPARKDHQGSERQYCYEPIPPPPPLPPVKWVGMKHFCVEENEQVSTSQVVYYANDLPLLEVTSSQTIKTDPPKNPHIKQDQQKFYGGEETIQPENCPDVDKREDLLNQIRSKSFSLRRTVPTRSTLPPGPIANNKVTAILEKANAIHQACVGSDVVGDDENWSDG